MAQIGNVQSVQYLTNYAKDILPFLKEAPEKAIHADFLERCKEYTLVCCHAIKYEIRDMLNAQSGSTAGYAETSEMRVTSHYRGFRPAALRSF